MKGAADVSWVEIKVYMVYCYTLYEVVETPCVPTRRAKKSAGK
jgi:hypothetical protein